MIRNRELVSRAKVYAMDRDGAVRERINAMIESYETACYLSVGADASRSKVWESHAIERRNRLCDAIGYKG